MSGILQGIASSWVEICKYVRTGRWLEYCHENPQAGEDAIHPPTSLDGGVDKIRHIRQAECSCLLPTVAAHCVKYLRWSAKSSTDSLRI